MSVRSRTAVLVCLVAAALAPLASGAAGSTTVATVRPIPASAGHVLHWTADAPPTTATCEALDQVACYSPLQFQHAYNVSPLLAKGITGRGETIAIIDSFGSPTIAHDLAVFDQAYGLPAPPALLIIQPAGPVHHDPSSLDAQGWAEETSLDVEYAHAMAPGANILLVETPVAETEGVQGFPEMIRSENFVIDHHLAQVISQSFGATENTFPSKDSLLKLRSAFLNAQRSGVTVLGASGDTGATDYKLDSQTLYDHRVNSWPSSDPLVTSVGGTQLTLDSKGNRTEPDVAWAENQGASGGGLSEFFARPSFQNSVQKVVAGHRGTPDIAMAAATDGAAIVYCTAPGSAGQPINPGGWDIIGGTSEATPLFAGIVALAAQYRHGPVGDINDVLYDLAKTPAPNGIIDVTVGDNSQNGVEGYRAGRGYDLVTGWGTINAASFVPALAIGTLFAAHLRPF